MSVIVDIDKLNELRRQGYTYKEIADKMGVSPSTVNRRLIKPSGMTRSSGYTKRQYNKKENLNGECIKYLPEYKREITPKTHSVEYEYKGVKFFVAGDNMSASIVVPTITDVIGNGYEPMMLTASNIQQVIDISEALVGVANYIRDHIK